MPASAKRSLYRMLTYCAPLSEWWVKCTIALRLSVVQRLGIQDKLRVHGAAHTPAHDAPCVHVDHKDHVQPALPGRNIGEIRYPGLVGPICLELTADPVLRTGCLHVADGGAYHLAAARALQHQAFHQTLHRAAGNAKTFALHLFPDFVCTVDLFVGLSDALDVSNQRLVTLGTRAAQLGIALMGGMAPIA